MSRAVIGRELITGLHRDIQPLRWPSKVAACLSGLHADLLRRHLSRPRAVDRCRWRLALLTAIELALIVCGWRRGAVHGPIMVRLTRWARLQGRLSAAGTTWVLHRRRSRRRRRRRAADAQLEAVTGVQ